MKTFRQCAEDNGVSVQAIYQVIKRIPDTFASHVTKDEKGIKVMTAEGERLLIDYFKGVGEGAKSDQPLNDTLNEPLNGLNESLNEPLNDYLKRLIEVRDQEIQRLLDQNQTLAENNRVLTLIIAEHTRVKAIPYQDIIKEAQDQKDQANYFKRALNRLKNLFKDV